MTSSAPNVVSARWLDAGHTMLHVEFDDGMQFSGPRPFAAPYDGVYEAWTGTTEDLAAPVAPGRTVPGAALVHVLDKATKVTPRDLAYVAGLNAAREDMASIVRIAAVDGLTPDAWFDAALAS